MANQSAATLRNKWSFSSLVRKLGDSVLVGVIKPAKAERQLGDGQVKPNQTFLPGSLDARIGRAQTECQLRIN
jgi:hypothetical protein